jgi:hypothetical protein
VDRRWRFGIEHRTAVPVNGAVPIGVVLRASRRERAESGTDAALGRAVHPDAFLWRAENDRGTPQSRLCRQSETSPATTAADGPGSDLSETAAVEACTWPSHLSIPAAQCCDHAAGSSVVERYHVYPATSGVHLSRCGHRLVQPVRAQLGNLDEPGCNILLLGIGPRIASRLSGNLQHGPRSAIHQRCIHQPAGSRKYPDQHGRPRPGLGQCFRRAALADGQIRRCLSQGLQRSSRRGAQPWIVLQVLQSTAAASSVGLSNARSRVPRSVENKDAASRQLLLMSFKGMRKSIRMMEASTNAADASAHLSDEFPAGYSLTRCSPAELVSASPAGVNDAVAHDQLRGFLNNDRTRTEKRTQFHRQQSTLTGHFFCPKNGETLNQLPVALHLPSLRHRFVIAPFQQTSWQSPEDRR